MDEYTATEVAYNNGFEAGKKAAAKELLEELDETLTAKLEAINKAKEDPELTSPIKHTSAYWLGRAVTCGELLRIINLLRKGYEVD